MRTWPAAPPAASAVSAAAEPGRLAGILLAAGAGRRFGGPKQLAVHAGRPLAKRIAGIAIPLCPAGLTIVTGAHANEVWAILRELPVRRAHNPRWRQGLGSSLHTGIAALPACGGILVLSCDQPGITRDDLAALVAAWRRDPARPAAARYSGVLGIPAVLPWAAVRKAHWPGDVGARMLLRNWPGGATGVSMPAAAHDVDTRADLHRLTSGGCGSGAG